MTRISDRTNDKGNIVAGIAVLILLASLVLIVCECYVSALSQYGDRQRSAFLTSIDANNAQ